MFMVPIVFISSFFPQFQLISTQYTHKDTLAVSFKCPTENIGVKTPSSLFLHSGLDKAFYVINSSNMSPLYLEQVCR